MSVKLSTVSLQLSYGKADGLTGARAIYEVFQFGIMSKMSCPELSRLLYFDFLDDHNRLQSIRIATAIRC